MVLCLNILKCSVEESEQAKIRFQFAVFNADVNYWEYCNVSRTILELRSTTDIISLGYRDMTIVDRHLKKNGELCIMVKIQIIQCESEKHTLSQVLSSPFNFFIKKSWRIFKRQVTIYVERVIMLILNKEVSIGLSKT